MFGEHRVLARVQPRELAATSPALSVQKLHRSGVVDDIDFKLRRGEVRGFAGMPGAGRTERLRSIFGAEPLGYMLECVLIVVAVMLAFHAPGFSTVSNQGNVMPAISMLGIIGNGMTLLNVSEYWQYVVRGALIVAAVMLSQVTERRR